MKRAVKQFVAQIENEGKRADTEALLGIMEKASGYPAWLSGSIIGFGRYHYVYASGRTGTAIVVGFSPRKQNIAVYIMPGFPAYGSILASLGKYKTGKSCLYINKLDDVDIRQLQKLVTRSVRDMQKKYRCERV